MFELCTRSRTMLATAAGMAGALDGIRTPDGRYLVVRGRLWRAANPSLSEAERSGWVRELMNARRAKGRARADGDVEAARGAREAVDEAKRALGERGPAWWQDGAADHNRRMVVNTPYRDWYGRVQRHADAILRLLQARTAGASICPSDAARAEYPAGWRTHLDEVREAARHLARRQIIEITQRGKRLDPEEAFHGPIRFRRL